MTRHESPFRFSTRWGFSNVFLAATILTLSGCGIIANGATALVWANHPSIALYAERFNADQSDYRVHVLFRDEPQLEMDSPPVDIIVAEGLASRSTIEKFASLDHLFETDLSVAAFYPDLLDLGKKDERQLVLPLSFSLPALLFRTDLSGEFVDRYLATLEEVEAICREFTDVGEVVDKMGLSLRWDPDLLYTVSILLNAGFHETSEGHPVWFDREIRNALDYIRTWSVEVNGGLHVEDQFRESYMYDPMYKLLNQRRILFAYTDLRRYLDIPAEIRENFDFRWIAGNGTVPVADDIVYVGRLRQSKNKKAAEAFISWLFNPGVQKKLLEISQFFRMRSFGIAGGLSSQKIVNEISLPQFFPVLVGRIPPASYLSFPPSLPVDWQRIREEVVEPWLVEESARLEPAVPLSDLLLQWRMQQPSLP